MKYLLLMTSALLSASAWSLTTLEVPTGETYTVAVDQQRLSLTSLTLGDGARIRFADGVSQWQVRADRAVIGSDVLIEGAGASGETTAVSAKAQSGSSCKDGLAGENGAKGIDGSNGVSIRLQIGLVSLGDMLINTSGGHGGIGAQGGNGGDAGGFEKNCSRAPVGGDAGAGGAGGAGGDAGNITVLFWAADPALNVSPVANLIRTEASPGNGGEAGQPGQPGAGSGGRYVKRKTLTGSRVWVAGGSEGATAEAGAPGKTGDQAKVLVEQALISVAPALMPARSKPLTASSQQAEIEAIKQELRSLIQRLEQLEVSQ
ncbi:MAG: hypothetical protein GY712_00365 [Oceanicoccus sp.]|uniref:hypothetical protein n=1 Tax=Oceanicoccus sp. TaxID=2691044 RepID=UPI0026243617|nr:hypothetical protein [Oceanicoccus sp.]MCP3906461.1 hypothetical protein [Oceanicoccus sp.]